MVSINHRSRATILVDNKGSLSRDLGSTAPITLALAPITAILLVRSTNLVADLRVGTHVLQKALLEGLFMDLSLQPPKRNKPIPTTQEAISTRSQPYPGEIPTLMEMLTQMLLLPTTFNAIA